MTAITLRLSTPITDTHRDLDIDLVIGDDTNLDTLLTTRGFIHLTTEEGDDVDMITYRHPVLGDVDVMVWHDTPKGFIPTLTEGQLIALLP
jgi:hypothetical protein